MARIRLKGVNSVRKRLADGMEVTYWYAWKGGPRLPGPPGSPDFLASYQAAVSQRASPPAALLGSVVRRYEESSDFLGLAPRTQRDYAKLLQMIERKFGTFPLSALSDPRSRGVFLDWRDGLARSSRRQADYAFSVLARILSWALNRGLTSANPCSKAGRVYRGTRVEKTWSTDDEAAFLRTAPLHLHLALLLALWTGQRQGDLLALPWSAYDGSTIRIQQSKTGARVAIPVGLPLRTALDNARRRSPVILTNASGLPWTPDGFRSSWRKACAAAGVTGLTFHDLRGTAVTRLALVGATEAEIATFTGHSLRDVRSILDAHYLNRDPALAQSAVRKLETGTKSSN